MKTATLLKSLAKILITQAAPVVLDRLAHNQIENTVITDVEVELSDLAKRVTAIEEHNQKIAIDKAWETSWTRRISIAALTYITTAIFLGVISIPNFWLIALIPTIGFLLSTLLLPAIKALWQSAFSN